MNLREDFFNEEEKNSKEENDRLESRFIKEEIKTAMFGSYSDGAPGQDGLPFMFFQVFWDVIRDDLIRMFHYCRMVQTRHYDQRPFVETVCDAIIANMGVKKRKKRCNIFGMTDASNTIQILVACAMQGIWFSSIHCLR